MKHPIVYLIGILSVCFVTFPMQSEKILVEWFERTKKLAEQEKQRVDELFAIKYYYISIATKNIPPATQEPDPYQKAREIQAEARNIIASKAQSAEKNRDYEEALELYNLAPDLFKDHIEATEKNYQTYVEKEEGYKLINWFSRVDTKAATLEFTNSPKAFFYYGLLADAVIPSFKTGDPYTSARKAKVTAYSKIFDAAKALEEQEKTQKALEMYKFAPRTFKDDIVRLEKKAKKENEERAEAVAIAQNIINIHNAAEAESRADLKLTKYGKILRLSLSCPSGAPEICKQALDIQKTVMNEMSDQARDLKGKKQYAKALAIYEYAGNVFDTEIGNLKPLVNILPELQQLIAQNKYDDAYAKLDTLIQQGVNDAKTYKKDLERQKAEQERLAKEAEEQPEREKEKKLNEKFKSLFAQAQTEAKKDISQALKLYGQIVQEPIPLSSSPDTYKEARAAQSGAFTEIITAADELMKQKKYEEALTAYNLIPNPFYNELDALKKRIAELPDLINEQKAQAPLDDPEKEAQLKKTLLQLTEKLRSLAHYITHAPL